MFTADYKRIWMTAFIIDRCRSISSDLCAEAVSGINVSRVERIW